MANVDPIKTSARLDRIAKEVDETAAGSSRVQMYRAISNEIRDIAREIREGSK